MYNTLSFHRALQAFQRNNGWLRTSQALRLGISPRTLYMLHRQGHIVRAARGLYHLADQPVPAHHDLPIVAQRVSKGVICLLSALAYYDLTTQVPHQVYVALPNHAEKPRLDYPPLRIFWLSERPYRAGIQEHRIGGIPVRMYSPEKSIADAFKFRNKIGLDVALEALKRYLQQGNVHLETLRAMARVNRVERIMQPYLEALLSMSLPANDTG